MEFLARTNPTPYDITITGAEGGYLQTKEYGPMFDMACGIAVNNLGHRNKKITTAAHKMIDKYAHLNVYGEFNIKEQLQYSELIAERFSSLTMSNGIAETNKTWFCNAGTEATELAMKLAIFSTKRKTGFLALKSAFHGRTLGSLMLTHKSNYRMPFKHLLADKMTSFITPGDEIPDEYKNKAAFFMELIQGEVGVVPLDPEWAKYVSDWCKENGVLLVIDEVQTGFGRTGTQFVLDQYQDVHPDIVTIGKAMGGGFPLAGVVASAERWDTISKENPFTHLSTFGGNPLSVAAGTVMFKETAKDKLLNNVKDGEVLARSAFQGFEHAYIRGRGLMLAVVLDEGIEIDKVVQNIWDNGVFCGRVLLNDNSIRLYAPLNTTQSEIYNKFGRVRDAIEKSVK